MRECDEAKFTRQLCKFSDLRCCLLVGGQGMEAQFEHLANNPEPLEAKQLNEGLRGGCGDCDTWSAYASHLGG